MKGTGLDRSTARGPFVRGALLPGLLFAMVFGGGCGDCGGETPAGDGGPSDGGLAKLTITAPRNGATFTAADDVDPDTDGIQIDVEVAVEGTPKGEVELNVFMPGRSLVMRGQMSSDGSEVVFSGVTIAATSTGTDNETQLEAVAPEALSDEVTVTGVLAPPVVPPFCEITGPADGDTVSDADPEQGGVQIQVAVRCDGDGVGGGTTVEVEAVADGQSLAQLAQLAGDGSGNFVATLLVTSPLDDTTATLTAYLRDLEVASEPVSVTVPDLIEVQPCDATLTEPADGTVFDSSAVDEDAQAAGFQKRVVVDTGNAACAGALSWVTVDDGAASETFTGPVAANGTAEVLVTLPDGTLTITADVENEAGFGQNDSVAVTVDRTAPTIALTSPTDGQVYGPAADLDGDSLNGISLELAGAITGATSASYDLSCTGDNTASQSGELTLDENGAVTAVTLADLPTSSCTLTVTATDGRNESQSVIAFEVATVDVAVSLAGDADGNGYWIASEDATAGGDMEIPLSVEVTFGNDGTTYTASASVLRASDEQVVQGPIDLGTLASGVAATATIALPSGDETEYRVEVTVTPSAGAAIGPARRSFFVDTVAPTLAWQAPGNNQRLNASNDQEPQTAGFQAFYALATTGLAAGSTVAIDITGTTPVASTCTVAANALCIRNITTPDGNWTATATAADPAGNVAAPADRSFVVDATLPTVQSIAVAADVQDAAGGATPDGILNRAENGGAIGTASSTITVTFAATAGLEDGRQVTLTVEPGQSYTAAVAGNVATFSNIALPEGNLTLSVAATDAAGNPVAVAGRSRGFRVDTTPPSLVIAAPAGSAITGASVDVVISTNAENGQQALLHDVTGGAEALLATVDVTNGGATFSGVVLAQGERTLRATVLDLAGNESTTTRTYTVDSEAPSLTLALASDATVDADPSAPGFQVDFTVDHTGLEAGRRIDVISSETGVRGFASAEADGETVVRATFTTSTVHTMSALARDVAGNLGTSNTIDVDIATGLLDVLVDSPDVVAGALLFGSAHVSGGMATMVVSVPGAQANATAELRIGGTPVAASITQTGDTFTVTWSVTEGETGALELFVDDGMTTGTTGVLGYEIDAAAPTIAWAAGTPTVFNIAADEQTSVSGLQLTAQVTVDECEHGVVEVLEGATRIGGPLDVDPSGSATVTVLIDDTTEHDSATWTARCTGLAGDFGTADLTTKVDLTAPAAPSLTLSVVDVRRGQIRVEFTAPGDDGVTGAPASIQVVASREEITEANFDEVVSRPRDPVTGRVFPGMGGLVDESTTAAPGTAYVAQTEFLAFDNDWYVGVRAVDEVGNASFGFGVETGLVTQQVSFTGTEDDAGEGATLDDEFGQPALTAGDLDGDGRDDFVVLAFNEGDACAFGFCEGVIRVYPGRTELSLASGPRVVSAPPGYLVLGLTPLIVPDMDGDGRDELLVEALDEATFESRWALYYGTNATGPSGDVLYVEDLPSAWMVPPPGATTVAPIGDVDGDGYADLAWGGDGTATAHILFGSAQRIVGQAFDVVAGGARVTQIQTGTSGKAFVGRSFAALGNLDGDTNGAHGVDDFAVVAGNEVFVLRGRTTWPETFDLGTVSTDARIPCTGGNCGVGLGAGDSDGDGDVDLLVYAPPAIRVFHQDAPGSFADAAASQISTCSTSLVGRIGFGVLGDVNGDEVVDVAVACGEEADTPSHVAVYFGGAMGARTSTDATYLIPFTSLSPVTVAPCGDLDADGLDEICFGSTFGGGEARVRF